MVGSGGRRNARAAAVTAAAASNAQPVGNAVVTPFLFTGGGVRDIFAGSTQRSMLNPKQNTAATKANVLHNAVTNPQQNWIAAHAKRRQREAGASPYGNSRNVELVPLPEFGPNAGAVAPMGRSLASSERQNIRAFQIQQNVRDRNAQGNDMAFPSADQTHTGKSKTRDATLPINTDASWYVKDKYGRRTHPIGVGAVDNPALRSDKLAGLTPLQTDLNFGSVQQRTQAHMGGIGGARMMLDNDASTQAFLQNASGDQRNVAAYGSGAQLAVESADNSFSRMLGPLGRAQTGFAPGMAAKISGMGRARMLVAPEGNQISAEAGVVGAPSRTKRPRLDAGVADPTHVVPRATQLANPKFVLAKNNQLAYSRTRDPEIAVPHRNVTVDASTAKRVTMEDAVTRQRFPSQSSAQLNAERRRSTFASQLHMENFDQINRGDNARARALRMENEAGL